jgi:hypothetical protein
MRVTSVLLAQTIRFVSVPSDIPEEKRIPIYPLVKGLQERYSFLQTPLKVEDFDFKKGVTFLKGLFEHKVIEKFQVYERGVLCESKVNTDYCEQFIDDVLDFGIKSGLPFSKASGPDRGYFSSLEVQMNGELDEKITKLSSLAGMLAGKFKSYGVSTGDYSTIGFKLGRDESNVNLDGPRSTEFVFERRAAQPHSSHLYASWGSLRTTDHLEVLQALETAMEA